MKKIGRNAPCPCGSGKKYKHCCMREGQPTYNNETQNRNPLKFSGLDAPKIKAYLESHDLAPLLDYLVALQLNPSNNGKNLRFDHIGQLMASSLGKGTAKPDVKSFKDLIDEEYPYDVMEDIPINMFCERVVFYGGNYLFFPGLATHCSELFRSITESIFGIKNHLPEAFKSEVYQGITLMLELGNSIAKRAGIEGMTRGNRSPREKISDTISTQHNFIPREIMESVLKNKRINENILNNFLLDKDDPELLTSNPERNPILYKPIVEFKNNFYFIGISNQGSAINNFMLKTATIYNCIDELVELTQTVIWKRLGMSCINIMHWNPIEFDGFLPHDAHFNECLFRIDVNWIAYLCYVKDTKDDVPVDGAKHSTYWDINSRLKNTLASIRGNNQTKDFHIFTLVVYSSMGEPFGFRMDQQHGTDYLLHFPAFDFLQLVQTEKWDNMSLVRYARTKAHTPALNRCGNQSLDCYYLYKNKGESFYLSDDQKPNFIQIEPNEGCELIHNSKELLNFHAIPIYIEGKGIGYMSVQRDLDYDSIYKPLNHQLTAKCCSSYSLPIWVKCTQREDEGENPSSITETFVTAIVFWMNRLRPAIEGYVIERYKTPIEIELCFEKKTLSDKHIHTDIMQSADAGSISVCKTKIGVKVMFDHDFTLGFLGADNAQERFMMMEILKHLINVNKELIQVFIDEVMPLGPAKMILMSEASNNPISYPLWLNPPIIIHSASRQLMMDLFPEWMNEKGFDIVGKLTTKDQKTEFLHHAVDVLLEKLNSLVRNFDKKFLLKSLISNHETLIFQKEHNKLLHPAQIICFGDNEEKRQLFFETERQISESALATRALIEYVAAEQDKSGHRQAGNDDIESLLSIMSNVINFGGICDAIQFDMADHNIAKLLSGRYVIADNDFNQNFERFASARTREAVNNQVETFGKRMEHLANLDPNTSVENPSDLYKIDAAFSTDWGISYSAIVLLLESCYLISMKQKRSVIEMPEKDFVEAIFGLCPELDKETIQNGLRHLVLEKRESYLIPPKGMDVKEIRPWIYNRELSNLRRPIVRWRLDGHTNLIFGFRSCQLAVLQLTDLLYSGRLKNGGKSIDRLLGKFQSDKGKTFNEHVREWLKEHTILKVWEYDVPMKPKSALKTSEDLGDIDVLAYDIVNNIVYSIECKNTNTAKNVREMKKEMDDYLGRDGNQKKVLVMKHLRRHHWLISHITQVRDFVGAMTNPSIKSVMLTSEVIPTSYLRQKDLPLSILNFQELKKKGIEYLNESKQIDITNEIFAKE